MRRHFAAHGALLAIGMLLAAACPVGALARTARVHYGTYSHASVLDEEHDVVEEEYYYSDSYFDHAGAQTDAHLRSMSAALALATIEGQGDGFVTTLYGDIGFTNVETADMVTQSVPTRDMIGTAIARRRVNGSEVIAVAIRGGACGAEHAASLTIGASGDASGYAAAAQRTLDRIRAYRQAHAITGTKYWIVGYGRGGAVANLVAREINEHLATYGTTIDSVFAYTFSAPLSSAKMDAYANIHNVVDANDLVPWLLPDGWGLHGSGVREVVSSSASSLTTKLLSLYVDGYLLSSGTTPQDVFAEQFAGFLAEHLSREQYASTPIVLPRDGGSITFETALTTVCELYLAKPADERAQIDTFRKEAFMPVLDRHLERGLRDDVESLLVHNTDENYLVVADELVECIDEAVALASGEQGDKGLVPASEDPTDAEATPIAGSPLTDDELVSVKESVYPLLRVIGPLVAEDYYATHDKPSTYDDPYDPTTDPERRQYYPAEIPVTITVMPDDLTVEATMNGVDVSGGIGYGYVDPEETNSLSFTVNGPYRVSSVTVNDARVEEGERGVYNVAGAGAYDVVVELVDLYDATLEVAYRVLMDDEELGQDAARVQVNGFAADGEVLGNSSATDTNSIRIGVVRQGAVLTSVSVNGTPVDLGSQAGKDSVAMTVSGAPRYGIEIVIAEAQGGVDEQPDEPDEPDEPGEKDGSGEAERPNLSYFATIIGNIDKLVAQTLPQGILALVEGQDSYYNKNYYVLSGAGQYGDGFSDITMRVNGDADKFARILVDGQEPDEAHYDVASGSTIVTMHADYLQTLGNGSHTVTFEYVDGEASTTFGVLRTSVYGTSDVSDPSSMPFATGGLDRAAPGQSGVMSAPRTASTSVGQRASATAKMPQTGDISSPYVAVLVIAVVVLVGGVLVRVLVHARQRPDHTHDEPCSP